MSGNNVRKMANIDAETAQMLADAVDLVAERLGLRTEDISESMVMKMGIRLVHQQEMRHKMSRPPDPRIDS